MSSLLHADPPIQPPPYRLARFSVDQYHQMLASGTFDEDDRVELLDGWVVEKMPKGPAHELVIALLMKLLERILPPGWHVRNQAPITMADSEPEPDLSVVRGAPRDYADRHPAPGDVAIVIEVADTSLAIDRLKIGVYAANGIPECWIVNLPDQCVEIYKALDAVTAEYSTTDSHGAGESVEVVLQGRRCGEFDVGDCLP